MMLFELQGLKADMALVDQYMLEFLPPKREWGRMQEILTAVMSAKGKRYRPMLLLLASRCGPNRAAARERVCKLGAIVELIHMASLIHDDIVDDSPLRRGQQTIQSRFGKDMAVYTGDMILGRAMGILFRENLSQAGGLLGATIEEMCRGEIGQFDSRFQTDGTVDTYLQNVYGKTVSLFETACRLGGTESGCSQEEIETLAAFGRNLGYLFQLRDDMLDFLSDEEQEGKPIHMDFREGVFTMPVLYALEQSDYHAEIQRLAQLAKDGLFSAYEEVQLDWVVRSSGGLDATVERMDFHRRRAIQLAENLSNDEVSATLKILLSKLTLPDICERQILIPLAGRAV